jgi:hypothetical protein
VVYLFVYTISFRSEDQSEIASGEILGVKDLSNHRGV